MLNELIAWSLRNRVIVLAAAVVLLVAGTITARRMPVDVFPDLTASTVTVLTEAHGMAPEEVESLVSFPIETAVNGSTGVRRVRSSTAQGISVVWVEFDWGTDIFRARQIVAEKLQAVANTLPVGIAAPTLAPVSSVMGEIMMIGLTLTDSARVQPTTTMMDVRTIADWTLRRRLLAVPGVAQVIPIGGDVKQYQVIADPARMLATGVTLSDVVRAAAGSNANAAGGVYMDKGQEYVIRGIGRVQSTADIAGTVVAVRGGIPVILSQVADVRIGAAPKYGDGSVNAAPAVVLAVQKQPGANTLELTTRIERELTEMQRTLPPDVRIESHLFRQSSFITVAIDNVLKALRDGGLLVVVVLFLFLWNVRTTVISLIAIPLSLVVAIFAMKLFGISVNTMSLGGMAIAIGALVDDAIIDVENVFRRLKENHHRAPADRLPSLQVVYDASREIRASIVKATLIIIVVFLPLFFLGGVEGRLLRPLGFAYVVSILASLLVAVTVTPVMCAYLLPNARAVQMEEESALVRWLKARYAPTLEFALAYPKTILGIAGAALLIAVAAVPLLGTAFLPEFNEGALTVSVVTVPGTSLSESNAIGQRVEKILLANAAVINTDRRQGRAELDEHAQGVNAAEIDVTLKDEIDKAAVFAALREEFSAIPGTNVTIGQPIGHRIDHMLSGTRANIAVKIFGPDLMELRQLGARVRDAMQSIDGVADLQLEQQMDVPRPHGAGSLRHDRWTVCRSHRCRLQWRGGVASARRRAQCEPGRTISRCGARECRRHRRGVIRYTRWPARATVTIGCRYGDPWSQHHLARGRAAKDCGAGQRRRTRPGQYGGRHSTRRARAGCIAGGLSRELRWTIRGPGGIHANPVAALVAVGGGDLSDSVRRVPVDQDRGAGDGQPAACPDRRRARRVSHGTRRQYRVAGWVRHPVRHRDTQRDPAGITLSAAAVGRCPLS